ncbi:MAG: hypothetical protein ACOVQK_09090, partial [Cyanobium sp.]
WALPSKPGHWGARTFLNRFHGFRGLRSKGAVACGGGRSRSPHLLSIPNLRSGPYPEGWIAGARQRLD